MVRILIVDDDKAIREMGRMMFEYAGYEVVEAKNGMEALRILRTSSEQFIVLLDLLMPTMNGLDMLQCVLAEPTLSKRHGYVLVTASRDISMFMSERINKTLTFALMSKPFEMDAILALVGDIVQRIVPLETAVAYC